MKFISQPDIQLRHACEEDMDSLINLLRILFTLEKDFTFNEARQQRGLQLMLENSKSCILVALINDLVVGMCSGQLVISTAEGSTALLVEDVVVTKKWRGQGIGRKLLNGIAKWGEDFKAYRMQLLADRHNAAALSFYAHLDWEITQLVGLRKRQNR